MRTFRASFRQTDKPGGWDDAPDERGLATGFTVLDRCFDPDDPAPGTGGSPANAITPAAARACGGRWRPREFHYYGIESRLNADHRLFGLDNQLTMGVRWHQERVERDQFRSSNPAIRSLAFARTLTGTAHREDAAINVRALSGYLQNSLTAGAVTVTGGVRIEHVETTTLVRRAQSEQVDITVKQTDTVALPGIGAVWRVAPGTEIFAGVHAGFAPRAGIAHNFWLQSAWTFVPSAKFLVTSPAALSAGDGGVIGARCEEGNGCFNGNGVIAGTRLPYAPRHTLSLTLGYRHPAGIEARFGLDHRSRQEPDPFARVLDTRINASGCSDAACSGLAGPIPAVTLFNAGLSVTPCEGRFTIFASAFNLFDKRYLASRVDGMALGNPQTIVGGVRLRYLRAVRG